MIGGALFILGLLLTLAALVGARVIGARRSRVETFLLAPLDPRTWEALLAIGAGFLIGGIGGAFAISVLSAGLSLVLLGIGIVLIAVGIEVARLLAGLERRRVAIAGGPALHPHPYRPWGRNLRDLVSALFFDLNRWRDVVYVFVALPLTVLELIVVVVLWVLVLALLALPIGLVVDGPATFGWLGDTAATGLAGPAAIAAFGLGVVLAPVASGVTQGLLTLHRAVVVGLLCESEQRALRRRVERLEGSRRAVLDAEASELRRIERDLHDGAQQRLVMLAMELGRAAEKIDAEPEQARDIVLAAREQARLTLAELRDLVRGIAPSILMDRGLVPAIESLAGRSPVPTVVSSGLPAGLRLPDAVERAAYFVVAESLTNVGKHAAGTATRCVIECRREGSNLVVEVRDDGPGGAKLVANGGLAGLGGRVGALDGSLSVSSPDDGGTVVRAVIPVPGWGLAWTQPEPGPATGSAAQEPR